MATRTIHLETTSLEELVSLMQQHVEIVLLQGDTPLAKVSPVAPSEPPILKERIPDLHKGIWMSDDFDDPLAHEDEIFRAAMGDLLVQMPDPTAEMGEVDEAALMREIEEGTRGVTLSDAIIEERREGP